MKIAIDIQTTRGQRVGHGTYAGELVNAIQRVDSQNEYVLIAPHREQDLSMPQRFIWDQFLFPAKSLTARVDLLHQPAFSTPILYPGKKIVSVHDLIGLFFAHEIPFWSSKYFQYWMPFSYRFATHIIAVSEHTKKDIVRELKIPDEKITVIYEGISDEFRPNLSRNKIHAVKEKYQTSDSYMLHLATLNPRKNLEFLVRVFSQIAGRFPELKLVISGKKGWYYDSLFQLVSDLRLSSRVVFTGYVEDKDKPYLMAGARVFAFPSKYEGFGLPVVEAMGVGTPVVCSNTSSLPEVSGEATISLSPEDTEGWVSALDRVLSNPRLARQMSEKGVKQASKFSWDRAAEETIQVYERIANGK
jgi:glycosyltransferase involved in cell wall biosynthesis